MDSLFLCGSLREKQIFCHYPPRPLSLRCVHGVIVVDESEAVERLIELILGIFENPKKCERREEEKGEGYVWNFWKSEAHDKEIIRIRSLCI